MKIWTGLTGGEIHEIAESCNRSIPVDIRMATKDIAGSIAHVTMLVSEEIINKEDGLKITDELGNMLKEAQNDELPLDPESEDIHSAVEALLIERIGEVGKRLHTARSRNDQVATDLRLYLRDEIESLDEALREVINSLIDLAEENLETIMPGYTHMQIAQPVTFAHHMMAYAQMFMRDLDRLSDINKRMNESPLGACALAGTSYPINRHLTSQLLGFTKPMENSMDAVSDRDFAIELASGLSILQMHMSRICEELIIFTSNEFQFVAASDAFSTGSSIMPQKRNPDLAELIRGKSGRVNGNLISLLTMMKALPLSYNKDMQEDKEAIFDSVDHVKTSLLILAPMLAGLTVNKERMREAATKGFINATDVADYLTKKGLEFRNAYRITGELVRYCIEKDTVLEKLPIEIYKEKHEFFEDDIYDAISLENILASRTSFGGPAPETVKLQIERLKDLLEKEK